MAPSFRQHVSLVTIGCIGAIHHIYAEPAFDIATRHNKPPVQKHAKVAYPVSQESAYIISPCKPERDGYFGGTSGHPNMIQYGFEIESAIESSADITDALDTIREHVMDVVLSYTFPAICMIDRDLSTTDDNNDNNNNKTMTLLSNNIESVTGFHFEDDFDAIRTYDLGFRNRLIVVRWMMMMLLTVVVSLYIFSSESCESQQSIQNDCSIFTGLVSVYGPDVTTITLETLLQLFRLEFPSFRLRTDWTEYSNNKNDNVTKHIITTGSDNGADTTVNVLIQYGVSRLNISDTYTHMMDRPSDPNSDRVGFALPVSVRTVLAFILVTFCIIVGIYIVGRYLYMQHQINHYEDRFDDVVDMKKHGNATKSDRWSVFRRSKDATDVTETSSTSSSSSVSSWGTRDGHPQVTGNVRTVDCHPIRRLHQRRRRRPRKPLEFSVPNGGVVSMDVDPIYIVESDDDDDDDDCNVSQCYRNRSLHYMTQGRHEGNKSLYPSCETSSLRDDTERDHGVDDHDPLRLPSSVSSVPLS